MKVVCTAIVFDADPDHKKLAALFASTKAADTTFYVIGVDSKSVAGTDEWIRKALKKKNCDVFSFEGVPDGPFNDSFADARNLTLSRLPKDTDWWYWIDSDDTLVRTDDETLPQLLADVDEKVGAVFATYDYDQDQYGNTTCALTRGRIYRASVAWQWQDRVHEDVYPPTGMEWQRDVGIGTTDAFIWKHDTTDRPSAGPRNFRLLELQLKDEPDKPRTWYYLGNQHFATHNWLDAIRAYEEYLKRSNWTEQKWDALIHEAIAYRSIGLVDEAIITDTRAMHLVPEWADSYFGLGESYCRKHDWTKAIHFGEWGIQRVGSGHGTPDPTIFFNTLAYSHNPYRWLEVAYWNTGEKDKSLACLKQAAKSRPEPEILKQIANMEFQIGKETIVKNALNLATGLVRRNEPLKAKAVLENIPAGEDDNPNVRLTRDWVQSRIAHLDDGTAYRNLYFAQGESIRPEDAIEAIDQLPRMKWLLSRLQRIGAKKVLEVGVGNGAQSLYLASNGIQVVGIDIDRRRIRDANWSAVRMGLIPTKSWGEAEDDEPDAPPAVQVPDIGPDSRYQVHYAEVEDIPQKIKDLGPFDAVTACEIIEHVKDPVALLDAVSTLGPVVYVSTPDGAFDGAQEMNQQHVRALSQRDLQRLIVNRGRIVSSQSIASPYFEDDRADLVLEYRPGEFLQGPTAIIWCPDTGQKWSPESITAGGIGGSETAVIRVAEEMAERGYRVTVYAECEGVYNGVRYALSRNFRPQPCTIFAAWRSAGPLPAMAALAQHRFLWVHDVTAGDIPTDVLKGVTVLALSEWHKTHLAAQYEGAEIQIIGNGIDPERFAAAAERIPHRLIYAHSPDRGLDRVLALFPKVREAYPDATLDVYYGFDLARERDPLFVAEIERLARQPGVTLNGRVDQTRLAQEYLKADALIYPALMPDGNAFDETYCISVVEALAAGCFPVTADHGALRETNRGGGFGRLATFDNDSLYQLFEFWRRPLKEQRNIRDHGYADKFDPRVPEIFGRRWALQQTWAAVTDRWLALTEAKSEETVAAAD